MYQEAFSYNVLNLKLETWNYFNRISVLYYTALLYKKAPA
jgi:hypothetical protein